MANNFKNPWDVSGEYYNQNALNTEFLPKDDAYFTGVKILSQKVCKTHNCYL